MGDRVGDKPHLPIGGPRNRRPNASRPLGPRAGVGGGQVHQDAGPAVRKHGGVNRQRAPGGGGRGRAAPRGMRYYAASPPALHLTVPVRGELRQATEASGLEGCKIFDTGPLPWVSMPTVTGAACQI